MKLVRSLPEMRGQEDVTAGSELSRVFLSPLNIST